MIWLKRLLMILLVAVALWLGFWIFTENQLEVPFLLLGFELGKLPVVMWVLLAFALGIAIGALLTLPGAMHAKRRSRRYRQRLIHSERKLAQLEASREH